MPQNPASNGCRREGAGNWSPLVEVIHTLDAHRVAEAVGQIYEQPDQEHLILIDTFGGGSEAQDVLAVAAHLPDHLPDDVVAR